VLAGGATLGAVTWKNRGVPGTSGVTGRHPRLVQVRDMVVQQETAAVLEARAARSADPVLATVLHERAIERRRRAEGIRTHLATLADRP